MVTKKLGFGFMRPPFNPDHTINLDLMKQMTDKYMEAGFTYFDTAYTYWSGASENAIKECVVKRYPRDSFTVADKLPGFEMHEKGDPERIFKIQLERCGVEYFDYYLLHAVTTNVIDNFDKTDSWDFVEGLKARGLARKVGFSFHGTPEFLEELLIKHPFVEFVQLQINYLDWDNPGIQSRRCYEVARKYGKEITIMEPVKGGMLFNLPQVAKDAFDALPDKGSYASYAIRYAAQLEGLIVVLSGMSNMEQLEDNISYMADPKPITEEEMKAINVSIKAFNDIELVQCTRCSYCTKGCPMQLDIPRLFINLNNMRQFGCNESTMYRYRECRNDGSDAANCIACGQCATVCPQHLPIPDLLRELAETVGDTK